MAIEVGDRLPSATLVRKTADGMVSIDTAEFTKGRRVVIFGLPGAYTGTCSSAHLPSFVRTADQFRDKGIDDIACVSVNDAHVMDAWGAEHGAEKAGVLMLADGKAEFAEALGYVFDAPPAGMYRRMSRLAMIVNDGVVERFEVEESPGVCVLSAGEALLDHV